MMINSLDEILRRFIEWPNELKQKFEEHELIIEDCASIDDIWNLIVKQCSTFWFVKETVEYNLCDVCEKIKYDLIFSVYTSFKHSNLPGKNLTTLVNEIIAKDPKLKNHSNVSKSIKEDAGYDRGKCRKAVLDSISKIKKISYDSEYPMPTAALYNHINQFKIYCSKDKKACK